MKARNLGWMLFAPVDVILADAMAVQPDLLFVAEERKGTINPEGGIHGAPDLVVEVLTEQSAERDQNLKREIYGKFGAQEYWIVDPTAQTVEVLTLGREGLETWRLFPVGTVLASPLLPGLSIPVAEIFAE